MGQNNKFLPKHFSISVETKKKKKTKPEMEFRFCLILSLCLMANGLPKKTKTGEKLRASDSFDTKMERLDSVETKQKRMNHESGASGVFPVRLINNGVMGGKSGRLEVYVGGFWGTVCDDYRSIDDANQPDDNVAQVVCRMLSFAGGRTINNGGQRFGEFDGAPIAWGNVQCQGSEADISECRMTWFGKDPTNTNDCDHSEDIGIECD